MLSDLDSDLIKQVESERLHFIESEAEEIHGPLYSVPQTSSELLPHELYPDMQPEAMTPATQNAIESP